MGFLLHLLFVPCTTFLQCSSDVRSLICWYNSLVNVLFLNKKLHEHRNLCCFDKLKSLILSTLCSSQYVFIEWLDVIMFRSACFGVSKDYVWVWFLASWLFDLMRQAMENPSHNAHKWLDECELVLLTYLVLTFFSSFSLPSSSSYHVFFTMDGSLIQRLINLIFMR